MSCVTNFPTIITTITSDFIPIPDGVPKFIRIKNLPISPKYKAIMSHSLFDESKESNDFPILSTPPLTQINTDISPKKEKEVKKLFNSCLNVPKEAKSTKLDN